MFVRGLVTYPRFNEVMMMGPAKILVLCRNGRSVLFFFFFLEGKEIPNR